MSLIINGQTLANCTCSGIKSPHPMCDALFLFRNNSKKNIVSVELKGSHIDDGIEQLIETEKTPEYVNIKHLFNSSSPNVRIIENKVLISSTFFDALDQAKYRKSYKRYIIFIYYNKNTRIPNIRDLF